MFMNNLFNNPLSDADLPFNFHHCSFEDDIDKSSPLYNYLPTLMSPPHFTRELSLIDERADHF
jgi:hypothetical protein